MVEILRILKQKTDELENKIRDAEKLIKIGKEIGIDTTQHEIKIEDAKAKIKAIRKILEGGT